MRFKNGAHAIVIADVMGKGMPASMLMASLQASLQIIAPESAEPAEVVTRLNYLFSHNIRLTKFVTFFIGRYDEITGELTYCNAGHNPPLLRRQNGTLESLLPTGAAIGLVEHARFEQQSVRLHPGDRLLLYTDGVVESFGKNMELFGQDRLEKFLRETNGSSQETVTSLKQTVQKFSGSATPADDTTIVVATVAG